MVLKKEIYHSERVWLHVESVQTNASEKKYFYDILTKVKFNGNDNMQLIMKFDVSS